MLDSPKTDEHFERALHNPVQQTSASGSIEKKKPRSRGTEQHMAASGSIKASPQGFEPIPRGSDASCCNDNRLGCSGELGHNTVGAESGAVDAKTNEIDADLRHVIDAWPSLSVAVKQAIRLMVDSAGGGKES